MSAADVQIQVAEVKGHNPEQTVACIICPTLLSSTTSMGHS